MKTLTQRKANRLTPNEQLNEYCRHEYNINPEHRGITYAAQVRLYNNWQSAIWNWIQSLPL